MRYSMIVILSFISLSLFAAEEPFIQWGQSPAEHTQAVQKILAKAFEKSEENYTKDFKTKNNRFGPEKPINELDEGLIWSYDSLAVHQREKLDENRANFKKQKEFRQSTRKEFSENFDHILSQQGIRADNTHIVWALVAALHLSGDAALIKLGHEIIDSYQKSPNYLKWLTGYEWGEQKLNDSEARIYHAINELQASKIHERLALAAQGETKKEDTWVNPPIKSRLMTSGITVLKEIKAENEPLKSDVASFLFETLYAPQEVFKRYFPRAKEENTFSSVLWNHTLSGLKPSVTVLEQGMHRYLSRCAQTIDIKDETLRRKFSDFLAEIDSTNYNVIIESFKSCYFGKEFLARCILHVFEPNYPQGLQQDFIKRVMPFLVRHIRDDELNSTIINDAFMRRLAELENIFSSKEKQLEKAVPFWCDSSMVESPYTARKACLNSVRSLLVPLFIRRAATDSNDNQTLFQETFDQTACIYFLFRESDLKDITCLQGTEKPENAERALRFVKNVGSTITRYVGELKIAKPDFMDIFLRLLDVGCGNPKNSVRTQEIVEMFNQTLTWLKVSQVSKYICACVIDHFSWNTINFESFIEADEEQRKEILSFYSKAFEGLSFTKDQERYLVAFKGSAEELYYARLILEEKQFKKGFNLDTVAPLAADFKKWSPYIKPSSDADPSLSEEVNKIKKFIRILDKNTALDKNFKKKEYPIEYIQSGKYTSKKEGAITVYFFKTYTPKAIIYMFTRDCSALEGFDPIKSKGTLFIAPRLEQTHVRTLQGPFSEKEQDYDEVEFKKAKKTKDTSDESQATEPTEDE